MTYNDLIEHLEDIVQDAEASLARFKAAVADNRMTLGYMEIIERLERLESICAEHRQLMRRHFGR